MKNVKNRRAKSSSGGFTLIETALATVISSLLLVTVIGLIGTWQDQNVLATNQQRLAAIQQAIITYAAQNDRLPCPSSFLSTDAHYRRESTSCPASPALPAPVAGVYSAKGRSGSTDAYGGTPAQGYIIFGAVPVRDLGLPDSYIADAYGYDFTYAVTQSEVTAPLNPFAGTINVTDRIGLKSVPDLPFSTDNAPFPENGAAEYVVVDHGKDGMGAHVEDTITTTPVFPCFAAHLDQLNCSYLPGAGPATAAATPFLFRAAPFSNNPLSPGTWFDDTIIYPKVPNNNVCTIVPSSSNLVPPYPPPPAPPSPAFPSAGVSGASTGYNMGGYDNGTSVPPDTGSGILGYITATSHYKDSLEFGIDPGGYSTATASPTADAWCGAGYNVLAGGCTQTSGTPTGITLVTPPAPRNPYYVGLIDNYGADLAGASAEQVVGPPSSHPVITPAGIQGWECNGSSASGMQTQAYALCCN